MDELLQELKNAYGEAAEFRAGQENTIREVLNGKRSLVVQKTGWGKSLVYFLATKILRKRTKGITLIISPLLALMNNQIVSAKKLGLNVGTINSENTDNWEIIIERMKNNQLDALIISPERLANDDFKRLISTGVLQIALFVVDEAHCISDWGHDFRPDYRRIVDIIRVFPSNIPILATTATANDRVIEDIKKQLGEDIAVSRGSLMRKSLALQIIKLKTKEERLAWIADHIGELPGTGIIYCLTVNDCQLVHKWLCTNGISARCYYADIKGDGTESKEDIVSLFMSDQIKVLVATVAFGMGFDKPNIGFVIHFQKPGNIVAYYQQIGRAGRGIDNALAILLSGEEDNQINNYFIESAFPTENLMEDIVKEIKGEDFDMSKIMYEGDGDTSYIMDWKEKSVKQTGLLGKNIMYTSTYQHSDGLGWGSVKFLKEVLGLKDNEFIFGTENHDNWTLRMMAENDDDEKLKTLKDKSIPVLADELDVKKSWLKNPKNWVKAKMEELFLAKRRFFYFMDVLGKKEFINDHSVDEKERFRDRLTDDFEKEFHRELQRGNGFNYPETIAARMKKTGAAKENPALYEKLEFLGKYLRAQGALSKEEADKEVQISGHDRVLDELERIDKKYE